MEKAIIHVLCYLPQDDNTNTFQVVLATDGTRSFAIFLYLDDGIQLAEAQVGYDAGNGVNFLNVDGSRTSSIIDIETTSNIGVPGMYVFQLGFAPPG